MIFLMIHYKPANAHCYLNFSYSHPFSCKRSIQSSHLTRIRRLWSAEEDFPKRSNEMGGFFRLPRSGDIANHLVLRQRMITGSKMTS